MRALASLAMQGRSQAVMLVSGFAILSILFPPISVLSSAVVGLVTLRNGATAGFLILVLATVASGILSQLALGGIGPIIGFGLLLWLPVWMIAVVLRYSRSLAYAVLGGLVLGLVVIAGQYVQAVDPIAEWQKLLMPFTQSLVEAKLLDQNQQTMLVEAMAKWMPGVMAAAFFLQSVASVLLARWWQALLFNPGGFRTEFHELRLPRVLAVVTAVGMLMTLLLGMESELLLLYLVIVLMMGWFIQGLAVMHGIVAKLKANSGWILGVYLLIMFAMPHTVVTLACTGIADAWFNFRARIRPKNGPSDAG